MGRCRLGRPTSSGTPVYRLYNPYVGDHHFTVSSQERDALVSAGWTDEGIGWYSSDDNRSFPLQRQYNPYAHTGTHNYTLNPGEASYLISRGRRDEGVAWYGIDGASLHRGVPLPLKHHSKTVKP